MADSLVRELIAEHLAVPLASVSDEALFKADLGADSLDLIQLSMLLESRLGIHVADDEAECCVTVGDALGLVRAKTIEAS